MSDVSDLHDSVADKLPHTYRKGSLLITIKATEHDNYGRFTVVDAEAHYQTKPVALELPLHYIRPRVGSDDPLTLVETIVANTVRSTGKLQ